MRDDAAPSAGAIEDARAGRAAAHLARDGVVRLPGVVDAAGLAAMRARLWGVLATRGLERDAPATWRGGGALPLVELAGALRPGPGADELLWAIGRDPAFASLGATVERAIATALGTATWTSVDAPSGGLAAPNFPGPDGAPWRAPHAAWHVDEPTVRGRAEAWGLLAFVCLDDVVAHGGATVAIAGSHRRLLALADALAPPHGVLTTDAALAALVRDDAWFAALTAPPAARGAELVSRHDAAGVALRLVELTGAAGDVVLMDPRCLHTVSANASTRARLTMRMVFARS